MPHRHVGALVATSILALVAGNSTSAQAPTIIAPGRSIGPLTLGIEMAEAKRMLEQFGPVENGRTREGGMYHCNSTPGMGLCVADFSFRLDKRESSEFMSRTPGKVALITSEDRRFSSDDGIRAGTTLPGALRILGPPEAESGQTLQWLKRGLQIDFEVAEPGYQAATVGVFAPVAER